MKTARYSAPLALVRDRFILAISGLTGRTTTTKSVEVYDTQTNYWFNIADVPVPLINTSTAVMNNRYVYVLPGSNPECRMGSSMILHMLDSGSQSSFTGNKNDRSYGQPMANMRWQQLVVNNAEFVQAAPSAGI